MEEQRIDDAVKVADWPVLHREVRRCADARERLRKALLPERDRDLPHGQRSDESTEDFACRRIQEMRAVLQEWGLWR